MPAAVKHRAITGSYARHVGRIGALAVALGVGAAVATTHGGGIAYADDSSDSSSAGSSSGSSSNSTSSSTDTADSTGADNPTSPAADATKSTGSESSNAADNAPSPPSVPDMNVGSSGGALTSDSATGTDATAPTDESDAPEESDDTASHTAKESDTSSDTSTQQPQAPTPAHPSSTIAEIEAPTRVDAPGSELEPVGVLQPVAATTELATMAPSDVALEPTEPAAEEPSVVSTVLTAAIAPLVIPGPADPVQTPTLWALLAWTRRESEQVALAARDIEAGALAAGDFQFVTYEDVPLTDVLPNVIDSSIAIETQAAYGTVSPGVSGSFTYTPEADFNGTDSFTYTVSDGVDTSTYTVTITVTAVNDAPEGQHVDITIDEDGVATGKLPGYDADGDGVTFVLYGEPQNGSMDLSVDGTYTYTPNANFHGTEFMMYQLVDGQTYSQYTITITVASVNDKPTATDGSFGTVWGAELSDTLSPLTDDVDFDDLTYALDTLGAGSVTVNGDGTFTYTPAKGFSGDDVFTYTVSDANGGVTVGTVTVVVRNNTPVAYDDGYSVDSGATLTADAAKGLLGNDFDPDDKLMVISVGKPANGQLTWAADGSFTYIPNAGFSGTETLSYTVEDAAGAQATATMLIVVEPANQLPTVEDRTLETEVGIDVEFDPLEGVKDPEGDDIWALVDAQPANGFAQKTTDGRITYSPDRGFQGTDTFTYNVFDGTNTVTVTVTVNVGPSTAPVLAPDTAEVIDGGKVSIDVLDNDTISHPEGMTVELSSWPTHGDVRWDAETKTFVYTSSGDNATEDGFWYQVTDADGRTAEGEVTITVLRVNEPPVARDDWTWTPKDTPVAYNVLDNDYDPDGPDNGLIVTVVGQPQGGGKAEAMKDGTINFTPTDGFVGRVEIQYSVTDPSGGVAYATLRIDVDGGAGPNPDDKAYTIGKNLTLTVSYLDGLTANTDYEGGRAGIDTKPAHGTLKLNADGSFTYTPNKGFVGKDSFAYYLATSEHADGPFIATIEITPDGPGLAVAAAGDSAIGACWNDWMPWLRGSVTVDLTCLDLEARPEDM